MDGIGKEIQFTTDWDSVKSSIIEFDLAKADFNWDDVPTKLNFDFNVRAGLPWRGDYWEVNVAFVDESIDSRWSNSRSGRGTIAGEDVHMEWDWPIQENLDMIEVTLRGNEVEYDSKGHYGTIFRNIDLYLS